jgi:ferric-dicitrate binding protein FerR (iron transport regulator)
MAKTPETTPEIKLLQRYRSGSSTPEETRQVDEWFDVQENEAVPQLLRQRSVEEVNRLVLQTIRSPQQQNSSFILKIAAILLLTLMAGLFTYHKLQPSQQDLIGYITISTKAGERKTVTLPDSSRISLNNKSSIRFASRFEQKTRNISLTGEAFFEVRHDAARPFIVRTGKLHVQVLGTTFNVKAFPGEAQSKVTVASGKVGVYTKNGAPTQMLFPGEALTYDQKSKKFSLQKINADDQHAWQQGILIFKGENLGEIARQLERWYDVKISIQDVKLQQERFNIKQNNESLRHVLESLSQSGDGFQYQIKGRQVWIW